MVNMLGNAPDPKPDHHYHFVTGRLAEGAVRDIVARLAETFGFRYSIDVMPITVAALMTPKWLRRHLTVPQAATHVVLPGFLGGADETARASADDSTNATERSDDERSDDSLRQLIDDAGVPCLLGPKDCRELPEWFGSQSTPPDLRDHDIEIIAEINHVPRLSVAQFVQQAVRLREEGADRIDIGCDPLGRCRGISDYVLAAIDAGLTVSIDSFNQHEVADAVAAGATLVLSVNSSNRAAAIDWDCEVVVIPDGTDDLNSLHGTVDFLNANAVPFRLDPILEPIGAGLFASLQRYAEIRRTYPEVSMMMGIGNVTELTDVDSAGLNLLLLAICQELQVDSVLTTQVINWARSSVRECDLARRLVRYSVQRGVPPKRISDDLVMLRDPKLRPFDPSVIEGLAETIRDNNYRLFAQDDRIHLVSAGLHLQDRDAFRLFDDLMAQPQSENVDSAHAFYLGYEMAKASIALTLGKQYEQDNALRWGMLTNEETTHRVARSRRKKHDR